MSVELQSNLLGSQDDEYLKYRALSTLAVVGLAIGVLSCMALLAWIWLIVPVVGLVVSGLAWRRVRSMPDELTGLAPAKAGLALSALFFVAGPSWLVYEQVTEVPEGYLPITYEELQPDPAKPNEPIPASALALEGKKVFIKGYVYPGRERYDIATFLLIRDQGDCCFGGNPKITDRIQVDLVDPLRMAKFRDRLHKVAGVFHVRQGTAVDAGGAVFYELEADHLK